MKIEIVEEGEEDSIEACIAQRRSTQCMLRLRALSMLITTSRRGVPATAMLSLLALHALPAREVEQGVEEKTRIGAETTSEACLVGVVERTRRGCRGGEDDEK